jgi:hypothetical protein
VTPIMDKVIFRSIRSVVVFTSSLILLVSNEIVLAKMMLKLPSHGSYFLPFFCIFDMFHI